MWRARSLLASSINGLFSVSDKCFHSVPSLLLISELCILGFSSAILRRWARDQTMKAFMGRLTWRSQSLPTPPGFIIICCWRNKEKLNGCKNESSENEKRKISTKILYDKKKRDTHGRDHSLGDEKIVYRTDRIGRKRAEQTTLVVLHTKEVEVRNKSLVAFSSHLSWEARETVLLSRACLSLLRVLSCLLCYVS